MTSTSPITIAHRGASGEAPENTMAAFRLALEQGCDAIELDVHLSRDGQLVVCHDGTIDRTTDRTGAIRDMTADELKRADAGRRFGEAFEGERIPLLEEVFGLVPAEIMINVEIKDTCGRKLEPALLEAMRRHDRLDSVVVSSFDHTSLVALKRLEERVKIGLLYDCKPVRHSALAEMTGVPVYSLHPKFKRLDREDVGEAAMRGLQIYAYTINKEDAMAEAIRMGVSGVITDYPGRMRQLLKG